MREVLTFFSFLGKYRLFQDTLDIAIMAFIIYSIIRLVRETRAGQLVKGLGVLIIAYILSLCLNLMTLRVSLWYFFQYAGIAAAVIFQPEIRHMLEYVGRSKISEVVLEPQKISTESKKKCIKDVIKSTIRFQNNKTGALIVFERQTKLGEIIQTGTVLDAESSVEILGNLFFNKSPLHDGAVIIRESRIYAAGCILPLTRNENIDAGLGTRHRAALGMSENSDAILVIVSEETGEISIATNGIIKRNYTENSLFKELKNAMFENEKLIKSGKFNFTFFKKTASKKNREPDKKLDKKENKNEKN
ncbi:MAG: diadenylate cyclase CdaA [Oscillospiraceae bacterium]|jgi:diadenylate cyclase|nr:diadenylate cyclase CdaA [Oscillospiraceae bacterium]